jgi:hypothetical protein
MLRNRRGEAERDVRYWARRIRSPAFRRGLEGLITRELEALSRERVGDVVDRDVVRRVIREWDSKIINEQLMADLAIAASGRVATRMKKRDAALRATIDPRLAADLEALLQQRVRLSRRTEDLIGAIMRQEFVRRLFGDIIFTSIVAFHERVNPLFGGIAVRLLQEQIRSFIDLFMPMLQKQAVAFAVTKENQRILLDFVRAIIRHLLDAPVAGYAEIVSSWQKRRVVALVRKAVADAARSATLEQLIREMTLTVWDGIYRDIRDKRVGDVLRLEPRVGWLAQRCVDAIMPVLSRPAAVQFVAAEFAHAAAAQNGRLGTTREARAR